MTSPAPAPLLATYYWETLLALRACLCAQLEHTLAGKVCRCAVMPGSNPVADVCGITPNGEGQGWVRPIRRFKFETFPVALTDLTTCGQGLPGIEVELGVLRCAPMPDEDGQPPSAEDLELAAAKVADDSEALMYTAQCCLPPQVRRLVGDWVPLSGADCTGGTVSVLLEILPRGLEGWR